MGTDETTTTQVNGVAPMTQSAALAVEAETLGKFKKRVDDLLARLRASNADPGTLSQRTIARSSFGQGFAEAEGLAAAYEKVLSQLETFSKAFSDQIETLSIGSQVAERGYEAVDTDVKQRLAEIQRRTQGLYKAPQPDQRSADPHMGSGQSAGADGI